MSEATLRVGFATRLNEALEPKAKQPEAKEALVRKLFSYTKPKARRLLDGKILPAPAEAQAMAKKLGISPGYLMFGEGELRNRMAHGLPAAARRGEKVRLAVQGLGGGKGGGGPFEEIMKHARVMPSTVAQNNFGEMLTTVRSGKPVAIERNKELVAVVIEVGEYERLSQGPKPVLNLLTEHYDRMVASMQTPQFTRAMERLFTATPEQLGAAAVKAAKVA